MKAKGFDKPDHVFALQRERTGHREGAGEAGAQ
jgi:hypothetical protein